HGGKGVGRPVIEAFAPGEALFKLGGQPPQLLVAQLFHLGLERVDLRDLFGQAAKLLILCVKQLSQKPQHGGRPPFFKRPSRARGKTHRKTGAQESRLHYTILTNRATRRRILSLDWPNTAGGAFAWEGKGAGGAALGIAGRGGGARRAWGAKGGCFPGHSLSVSLSVAGGAAVCWVACGASCWADAGGD